MPPPASLQFGNINGLLTPAWHPETLSGLPPSSFSVPEGQTKIAQRFNVGNSDRRSSQVPKGRPKSLPQISLVLLAFNILNDRLQLRHADTERAVFRLPAKESVLRKRVMHPLGRAALNE